MRWSQCTGFLLLYLFFGASLSVCVVPEVRSEELSALNDSSDPRNDVSGEQELLAILNQERIGNGLSPLDSDEALSRIARNHSHDMSQLGFLSHDLPEGNLQIRLNHAGYIYEAARENLASARTVVKAHKALLKSPSHKENILATDVTRVGIGIVRSSHPCEGYLYITEIFATPREKYEPSMVQSLLENRVEEIRQTGGGEMDPDPLLDKLASSSLQSLNVRYDRTELQNLLAASASEWQKNSPTGLSRLEVNVQLLHNPKNLNVPASTREGRAQAYGSAVREVVDDQNQPAFLVLTLLGITR
jgi:uncharacterized protein YkwD